MADEVKLKKRKISDVFKKKNKEGFEEGVKVLGVKELEEKKIEESEEKNVENIDVQDSHEKKKKKFGHRRFLPSRKKNSKKQIGHEIKSQSQQVVHEEILVLDDGEKASQLEEGEEEFVKEKDNEESKEKDNSVEFTAQVQNVKLKCAAPEAVIQSDDKNTSEQTMAINVNENNEQLENEVLSEKENKNMEDGSLIRALLRDGLQPEETPTHEHSERTTDSTKQSQDEQKRDSNEIGKLHVLPNMSMFLTNFLDMMVHGSKSNDTGNPPDTKTETIYRLALQTADQTYSTLATLISGLLTRAGQIPKQALVDFLIYLIKTYPKCFKIKKVKRKAVVADDQASVDTVN